MKSGIHPTWYPEAVVTCACGNTWTTGSTKKEIHTDVCSNCHPFFTGEQRIVDTAGQVERFMKRITAKETIAAQQPPAEEKRAKKEKRRERRTGAVAAAPELVPPAELPLAVAQDVAPAQQPAEPVPGGAAEAQDNAETPGGDDKGGRKPRSARRTAPRKPEAETDKPAEVQS